MSLHRFLCSTYIEVLVGSQPRTTRTLLAYPNASSRYAPTLSSEPVSRSLTAGRVSFSKPDYLDSGVN